MITNSSQNRYNNSTCFGTKFDFINEAKYIELMDKLKPVEVANGLFGDCQEVLGGGSIYTRSIHSCTAYGLNKPKSHVLLEHCNKFAQDITYAITDFLDKGRAYILGGSVHNMSDYFEKDSKKFIDAKIPTTVFWGQNLGGTHMLHDVDNDICYICKNIGYDYRDNRTAESAEDIKKAYFIINVADGDTVSINNKFIDSALLNQNNDEFKYSAKMPEIF